MFAPESLREIVAALESALTAFPAEAFTVCVIIETALFVKMPNAKLLLVFILPSPMLGNRLAYCPK